MFNNYSNSNSSESYSYDNGCIRHICNRKLTCVMFLTDKDQMSGARHVRDPLLNKKFAQQTSAPAIKLVSTSTY